MGNHPDRAMMHVHFTVEVDEPDSFLARALLLARLWRARDIVPFV